MKIINVTYYQKKQGHDWGIKIYTDENKKYEIPYQTVETFLENNLCKLSTQNLLYLRKMIDRNIPTEYHETF
jgi:hypothetical protein